MHERFVARLEAGLQKLQAAAAGGRLRDEAVANRRLGRLLEKNWRAAKAFVVRIDKLPAAPAGPGSVTANSQSTLRVSYERDPQWAAWVALADGCYILRTNLTGLDPSRLPTRQAYAVAQTLFDDWLKGWRAAHGGRAPARLALSAADATTSLSRRISSRPVLRSSMRKMTYVAWYGVGRGRSTPLWMSVSSSSTIRPSLEAHGALELERAQKRLGSSLQAAPLVQVEDEGVRRLRRAFDRVNA